MPVLDVEPGCLLSLIPEALRRVSACRMQSGQDDPTLTDYVVTRWYRAPEACD